MPASKEQQWKTEEDDLLRNSIKQRLSFKDMVPLFPARTRRGLTCRAYTLGLQSGTPRTIHSKNESFWETPNAINSYYAGLAAADMSVGKSRSILAWTCATEDEEYMVEFVKRCGFTGSIRRFNKENKSICGGHPTKPLCFHSSVVIAASQKWCADLARNFNVVNNKTHRLRPPNLHSDYLKCCYLVGLLDGDGSVSFNMKEKSPHIAYGSASRDIVEWVREFVEDHFPFKIRARPTSVAEKLDGRYYHYSICGMTCVKLIELLRTIDVPRFKRKWDNPLILELIQGYHMKWPEYFTPEKELAFHDDGSIIWAATGERVFGALEPALAA